jgi:Tfp pilus assembly protein PilX
MAQAAPWLIIFLLIALMVWALVHESNRKSRRSVEEYEREVAQSKESLMRAGMLELDQFVGNTSEKRAAVEYIKDEKGGMTRTGGKADDDERTAVDQ